MGSARKSGVREGNGSVYFAARIPKGTRTTLEEYAREHKISASAAAAQLLEEALRMARFPGIDFRWAPSGRKPHVVGTGMSAWEVFHVWEDFGRNVERMAKAYPYLKADKINVAIAYAQAYPHERPKGEWGEKPPFAREVRI